MGYSPCIVADFGNFQTVVTFRLLYVFWSGFFAHNNFNEVKQSFFAPFLQFYFLTQTEHFAWVIAHASWPIQAIFKLLSFFECYVFFAAVFFAHNNFNETKQSFSVPFWQF